MTPRRRGGLGALAASADNRSHVENAAGARREQLREVAPADLAPSPWQPRETLDPVELDTLADSIREHGVLEPLLARALPGGRVELVAGHRRLAAAKLAELETVPVRLLELSDLQAQAANLTENLARSDLSPYETAKAIAALQDVLEAAGEVHTIQRLAQLTGRSRGGASMWLKTGRNIPEQMVTAVGVGSEQLRKLTGQQLYQIACAPDSERLKLLKTLTSKASSKPKRRARKKRTSSGFSIRDELNKSGKFSVTLSTPAAQLSAEQSREILERLQPFIDLLTRKAEA